MNSDLQSKTALEVTLFPICETAEKELNAPERKGEGRIFEAARFPAHIASANITAWALSIY